MAAAPLTLEEFFAGRPELEVSDGIFDSAELTQLREATGKIEGFTLKMVQSEVATAFGKLLNVKLVDIFLGAWEKLGELEPYLDPESQPSNQVNLIPLAEHTIHSTHQPVLEIFLREKLAAKLTFEVGLELVLESIVLKIQGGRIREIVSGRYQGTGTIRCRGHTVAQKRSPKYELPGKLVLGGEQGDEPRAPN